MREGLLGRPAAAARPAGHALGAMDLVAGMEVGAEIEVTEDGALEELPLRLENAKNCLSWESLDISSSDDDGEAYLTFCLPVRRPPRPAPRIPAQRPPVSPSVVKSPACEKRVPPLYPCPLRPSVPASPGIPVFGAYQCQKCLQVFMEEWHYSQHLQDHAQEEAQQQAPQPLARSHSPPRKLRCLECGKRFLHPQHFARHTKWHLKLVRKGIKVCRKKGGRRSSQVSYVYKPLGAAGSQAGAKDGPGLPVAQENSRQPKNLQMPRLQRSSKRKGTKQPKRGPAEISRDEEVLVPAYPENSMTILDGEGGVSILHPWQKKQAAILESQVAGGLFQPTVFNAENQIIILDDQEAETRSVVPERHYAEVQTTLFDNQMNAARPLFFRTEEQATILNAQVNVDSLQLGELKEPAAIASGCVGQNPCALFRTVLLQADEPAAVLDGQIESSPLQQVIIKTSEVAPTLFVDAEPHLSSLDSATLQFVPMEFVTVPYGNSLTVDQTEPTEEGEKAWESPATTFQFPGYLPNVYQQNKQPPPTAPSCPSPKGPLVVRLFPCTSGEHPEVLDLEYDTGGGIPVASEPWEASVGTGQEAYTTEEAVEDNFIIVEVEADSCNQGLAVDRSQGSPRRQALHRIIQAASRNHVRRFKCPDCGVCYSRMSQLRSHQKGPKRQGRSYLCECGASFRGLLHLLRHQLQHLEEALFICATCGKSLKGHRGLARHGTCHPGPARFGCHCGVSFQRLSRYLWHHVKSQRPGLRVYTLSGFLSSG
ncbi:zinc finger protein 853-like [Eublepharis macularius]|uniref:Zinc finger protein 853-like n=1 Tax=Eublepharis macularius TaxID=481883 RepID=A0AA97LKW0_EUBMA|nr:zinc finger protein 853-like [Eublepharis macularius]